MIHPPSNGIHPSHGFSSLAKAFPQTYLHIRFDNAENKRPHKSDGSISLETYDSCTNTTKDGLYFEAIVQQTTSALRNKRQNSAQHRTKKMREKDKNSSKSNSSVITLQNVTMRIISKSIHSVLYSLVVFFVCEPLHFGRQTVV